MRPYGSLWFLMGPYESLLILIDPNGPYRSLCVPMGPYWSLLVLIGADKFLWVFTCPYLSSFMGLYRSLFVLWISMCFCVSLWVLMRCYGSLRVCICFYASLWVLIGLFMSLCILSVLKSFYKSLCISMTFYWSL